MNLTLSKNEIPEHLKKFFRPVGHKPKDLVNVPHLVAEALREDGWFLRSAAPWVKRASMPESTCDRPSSALEYIFLLAKRPDYFYDADAVRQPLWHQRPEMQRQYAAQIVQHDRRPKSRRGGSVDSSVKGGRPYQDDAFSENAAGRNRRNSDWWFESVGMLLNEVGDPLGFDVNPGAFKGAHFATWPPKLVEPMIRASTSAAGVCGACGTPWRRRVEREADGRKPYATIGTGDKAGVSRREGSIMRGVHKVLREDGRGGDLATRRSETTGWSPGCTCPPHEPVPATVLDPFCGASTTLVVAEALGRNSIGCDLSRDYLTMSRRRLERPHARITTERPGEPLPLFDGRDAT